MGRKKGLRGSGLAARGITPLNQRVNHRTVHWHSAQADFAGAGFAGSEGLLLEFAISAETVHQQVKIHQVTVKFGAVDAGKESLPANRDTTSAAHAGAVH